MEYRSEQDWDKLLDPKMLDQNLKEAEIQARDLGAIQKADYRYLCKTNLFYLAKTVLGYKRLSDDLHFDFCTHLDSTRDKRFRLNLLPRAHFKTTIATTSLAIQDILPSDGIDLPHPYNLGPNARVLIGHETGDMASTFLFEITQHLIGNPLLMALYPELVPNPRTQRMNRSELDLPRSAPWKEATFTTMGVGGKKQGYHFNILHLDDLIGEKARDSEAEMATAKQWFDNIQAFFDILAKDVWILNGTRYANDDLYEHIMDRYGKQLTTYHRSVEEINKKTGKLEPIFKEEVTKDSLAILRKNTKVFNAQYMNDPDAGANQFDFGQLRWYEWIDERAIKLADKYSTVGQSKYIRLRDLYITILCDPAVTGLSGIDVTGTDQYSRTFVLEAVQKQLSPDKFVNFIFELVTKYDPQVVAIEEDLFAEVFDHWFKREMIWRGKRFIIQPVHTRKQKKEARVAGLVNYISGGNLIFNESRYTREQDKTEKYSDLIYQIVKFGSIKEFHTLDALAYGPEVWKPGFNRENVDDFKKAERAARIARTNPLTGYSRINYK